MSSDGAVLRGLDWPADGHRVVLVPAFGEDADAWSGFARRLAGHGFHVTIVEQRGHGLSDGEPDAGALGEDLDAACRQLRKLDAQLALITVGTGCGHALALGRAAGVAIHVLLSPVPAIGERRAAPPGTDTSKLLVAGSGDPAARAAARDVYKALRGWTIWASVPVAEQGTALLRSRRGADIEENIVMFLRRHFAPPGRAEAAAHRTTAEPGGPA
jgi:alpha-beta hydrolase superfamily lysophospholipase